jgi:hypothetical protein
MDILFTVIIICAVIFCIEHGSSFRGCGCGSIYLLVVLSICCVSQGVWLPTNFDFSDLPQGLCLLVVCYLGLLGRSLTRKVMKPGELFQAPALDPILITPVVCLGSILISEKMGFQTDVLHINFINLLVSYASGFLWDKVFIVVNNAISISPDDKEGK